MSNQQQQNDSMNYDSSQLPLRISSIQIEGVRHTNSKIPIAYLQILNDCRSVLQLNAAFKVAAAHMVATGLYTDVQFAVLPSDESKDFSSDVRVYCSVQERNRALFRVGVDQHLDQNTPTATASFDLLNPINGFGESLRLSVAKNAKNTVSSYALSLNNLQNTINSKIKYHIGVERNSINRDWVSGFTQTNDRLVIGGSSYDGINTVECELALRNAVPTVTQPEGHIVESTYEPNFKAALRYISTDDTRDNPFDPHRGQFYNLSTEVSGIVDDAAMKVQGAYQFHKPLNTHSTLSLSLRGGIQQPLRNLINLAMNKNHTNTEFFDVNNEYKDIPIYDRFFLGSMHTRGLSAADYGPKAGRHVFGSDGYVSATVSASTAIPNFEDMPIRPHVFLNATQLASFSTLLRRKYGGVERGLTDPLHFSASAGLGLVFPLSLGRVEINFASQLKSAKLMKPRISFAVSSNMDW